MALRSLKVEPGSIVRMSGGQSAADDFDALLEPGEYPYAPRTIDYRPDHSEQPYYFIAVVPGTRVRDSRDHWHKAGDTVTYHAVHYGQDFR